MKIATRCLNCKNVVKMHGTFSVKLVERLSNPLTGDVKESEIKGKLCRICAGAAGYKVKGT